jgi:murein DD-endopeptidase MepM/ murein hydrolase activator NlpD
MSLRALVIFIVFAVLLPLPSLAAAESTEPRVIGAQPVDRLHLVFPQDPQLTWFLDTFGARRGGGHVHIGNDLHAPKGSPVYAIAPGVVTRMAVSSRAGFYLVIDHGPEWTSWYMHLNNDDPGTDNGRGGFDTAFAAGISEGSFVDAGQLIGYVGDSGNAEHTLPHTHFELHRNGRAIDPYRMLLESHERALLAIEAERMAALEARIV